MNLKTFLTASRALFSITIILPSIVGGVIAWYEGSFDLLLFLLTLVGLFFSNIGTNLTNDYFDYKSGVDALDKGRKFKKGSEILLKDGLGLKTVQNSIITSFSITTAIGLYLLVSVDWRIILFGVVGLFIGYFYTAPPIQLGYRGLGELASGIGSGPLPVIGTYFVLTQRVCTSAIIASLPVGILVAAILYIGNVPDAEADAQVGKKTISVRLGREKVRILGPAFYASAYLSIVLGVLLNWLPIWTLLALLTSPMAAKIIKLTSQNYDNIPQYAPAIMMTVKVFALTSLLLVIGFITASFV